MGKENRITGKGNKGIFRMKCPFLGEQGMEF